MTDFGSQGGGGRAMRWGVLLPIAVVLAGGVLSVARLAGRDASDDAAAVNSAAVPEADDPARGTVEASAWDAGDGGLRDPMTGPGMPRGAFDPIHLLRAPFREPSGGGSGAASADADTAAAVDALMREIAGSVCYGPGGVCDF